MSGKNKLTRKTLRLFPLGVFEGLQFITRPKLSCIDLLLFESFFHIVGKRPSVSAGKEGSNIVFDKLKWEDFITQYVFLKNLRTKLMLYKDSNDCPFSSDAWRSNIDHQPLRTTAGEGQLFDTVMLLIGPEMDRRNKGFHRSSVV